MIVHYLIGLETCVCGVLELGMEQGIVVHGLHCQRKVVGRIELAKIGTFSGPHAENGTSWIGQEAGSKKNWVSSQ